MTLNETAIGATIVQLAEAVEGEAVSRSRVVDALLDLRLDAAIEAPHMVDAIDGVLSDLPGLTLVPVEWWKDRLDDLLLQVDRNPEPA